MKSSPPESQEDPYRLETVMLPTEAGYDRWAEVYDGEDNPLVLLEQDHRLVHRELVWISRAVREIRLAL